MHRMNIKNIIAGVLIAVTFFIAGMGVMLMQDRQSAAVVSSTATPIVIATLHLHRGGDMSSGEEDIVLDNSSNIVSKRVTYVNGTSSMQKSTGKLDSYRKQMMIEATLAQRKSTSIVSDPTAGPDMEQSTLEYTLLSGKTYKLQCVSSGSKCAKLTDALFADFHSILTHQGASD